MVNDDANIGVWESRAGITCKGVTSIETNYEKIIKLFPNFFKIKHKIQNERILVSNVDVYSTLQTFSLWSRCQEF